MTIEQFIQDSVARETARLHAEREKETREASALEMAAMLAGIRSFEAHKSLVPSPLHQYMKRTSLSEFGKDGYFSRKSHQEQLVDLAKSECHTFHFAVPGLATLAAILEAGKPLQVCVWNQKWVPHHFDNWDAAILAASQFGEHSRDEELPF